MRAIRRSLISLIVIFAPLLVVLWLGYGSILQFIHATERDLAPILAAEVSRSLGREVTVERVRVDLSGRTAQVDGLKISEGKTFARSQGRSFLSVRTMLLDFDLRKILIEKDPEIPLFTKVQVIEPEVRLARDTAGHWNFEDILRKPRTPAKRRSVGSLDVVDGRIYYDDASAPQNARRPRFPFRALLEQVHGNVEFNGDKSITAALAGTEASGIVRSFGGVGAYEPTDKRLYLRLDVADGRVPILNRFLPPEHTALSGFVSGQLTYLRRPVGDGTFDVDYQADVSVSGGGFRTARLASAVSRISGVATITPKIVTAKVDGYFAGSPIHTEGTVIGLKDPVLDGWASGKGLQLNRVLAALKLQDRYPALRNLAASADLRANVRGRPDSIHVASAGTARGQGRIPSGPTVPDTGDLTVAFSGTLGAPRFMVNGTVPSIRFRQYEARNVWVSAVYNGKRAVADFRGTVGGGTVTGRVDVVPAGRQSTYALIARARGVDISRLKLPVKQPVRGLVEGDITARGRMDRTLPQAIVRLRGSGIRYGSYVAHQAQARLRTEGDVVHVDRIVGRSGPGYLVASGRINVSRETMELRVEANEVDLSMFPLSRDPEGIRRLAGYAYLRDGRVTGPISEPRFSGQLRGYGVTVGQKDLVRLDLVSARVSGNLTRITIDGDVYRFPEYARVHGEIVDPTSKNARLRLAGAFEGVELQDLAAIARSTVDVSGTAEGSFTISGTASNPVVNITGIDVLLPSLGGHIFERLTAAVRYDASGPEAVFILPQFTLHYDWPGTAKSPDVVLRGSGRLTAGGRFRVDAEAKDVPMELIDPVALQYARVRGSGNASLSLNGRLQDGQPVDLNGIIRADTSQLVINDQSFGDLLAVINVDGRQITGSMHPLGPGGNFAVSEPGLHISNLVYNLDTEQLQVDGSLTRFELERLRLALSRSPRVIDSPGNVITTYLSPITKPLAGSLDINVRVRGPAENPDTRVTWAGKDMEIEEQPIQTFAGEISFNKQAVNLQSAELIADQTVLMAQGAYTLNGTLNADITLNNLSLRILRSWFPRQTVLAGLNGTVDNIDVHAEGTATEPVITASATLSDVVYQDSRTERPLFGGRPLEIPVIRTSTITYGKGQLNVGDIGILIREPEQVAPARPAPQVIRSAAAGGIDPKTATPESVDRSLPQLSPTPPKPRETYEAHASLSLGLEIDRYLKQRARDPNAAPPPVVEDNSPLDLEISIRNQGLAMIAAFLPTSRVALDGKIQEASLRYVGKLGDIRKPEQLAESPSGTGPQITGRVVLNADRIASTEASTEFHDLAVDLAFEGRMLRVNNFVFKTQVVVPRAASRKSEEVRITGSLPVSDPRQNATMQLTAPAILIGEAPLPGIGSGAIAAEIGTDNRATPSDTESLAITGSLLNPRIAGTVYIRNTSFRMPDTFPQDAGREFVFPLLPRFDLTFIAENNVRLAASLMTAEVRTSETEPVRLSGSLESPRLTGTLVVERGSMVFPTARFTIDRGSEIQLRYPFYAVATSEPSLGVILNVTARTRLSATSDISGQRRRYTIIVEARGPLNDNAPLQITDTSDPTANPFNYRGLRLTFRSDPPDLASNPLGLQRKVTGILGGQEQIEGLVGGRLNVGGLLTGFVSDVFLPELFEQAGIGRLLGLEEFEIETSSLNAFSLRLTRQLFGPVYLSYWRRLSGVSQGTVGEFGDWELRFSYRLPKNLQLSYTINEQAQNAILFEGVFRFR